jgi:hypothetical protein
VKVKVLKICHIHNPTTLSLGRSVRKIETPPYYGVTNGKKMGGVRDLLTFQ